MKTTLFGKTYNTDTAFLVKCDVEVEDLGSGYTRYNTRKVYHKQDTDEYFLYVNKTAVKKNCDIFDEQEFIIPVEAKWAVRFNKETPERWG